MGCSCLGDGSVTLRQPVSFSNSSNGHCSPVAVALRSRLHSSKTRTAQDVAFFVLLGTTPLQMVPIFPGETGEVRRDNTLSCTYDRKPRKSCCAYIVVYTTLSRAPGVQGIYRASISNICSAVAGTAYVVCAEPFILWLPRLQLCLTSEHNNIYMY